MAERRPYALTRPCALCPFRTDVKPYLTPARVREIEMMRISERLGLYDRTRLDMGAPVFDSFEEMIDAQPRRRPR